jgi:hypothetical protein
MKRTRDLMTMAALAVACAFAACSEGSTGGPVPLAPTDEPETSEPAEPASPAKRFVYQRNPYGNVAVTDNLLWDGDFEFRPSFPEQYGWLVGSGFGVTFGLPDLGTGSRCRSGIKCAVLSPGRSILGIAVSSKDRDLLVSFWAFVDDGTCEGVNAVFIPSYEDIATTDRIPAVQPEPFEDGWCKFEAVVPAQNEGGYLSIESQSVSLMVIDDAVVRAVDPSEQRARSSSPPLPQKELSRLEAVRASARRARLPRRAPPTRGEEILSAHLKELMR